MDLNSDKRQLILSVGELARLVSDSSRSSSGPSFSLRGRLGSEAHRRFQEQRRKAGAYRQEVHLDVALNEPSPDSGEWLVRIRGRLDGLVEEIDRSVIEEIKTVAMSPKQFEIFSPTEFPRHLRQVEIYTHLLSLNRPERLCCGRLIYINLPDGKKRSFEIPYETSEIETILRNVIDDLIDNENRRAEEAVIKRSIADKIKFPFKTKRAGQSEIIGSVFESLDEGRDLLFEAPTGLGKTVAVLYASMGFALKEDKQLLFLTSKTTQQDLVFETADSIRVEKLFPRILLLRARQKLCLQEEMSCDPEECAYLENFESRLRDSQVIDQLLAEGSIYPDRLSEIGEEHKLCPHELQLRLCEDIDLIVGDYNYAFDPTCRLTSLFEEGDPSRLILIVDEAHNLPDRARGYYSAKLEFTEVASAVAKLQEDNIHKFDQVIENIKAQFEYYLREAPAEPDPYPIQLALSGWEKIVRDFEMALVPYWYRLAAADEPTEDDPVLSLFRKLENIVRVLNYEGDNFAHLIRRNPAVLEVLCLDAAPFLKQDFSSVHAGICMSATLQPIEWSAQLLGSGDNAQQFSLENPFPRDNCRVLIDTSVTTLYREREENVTPIARLIERFYNCVNERTLAFFPSYALMERIVRKLQIEAIFIQEEGASDKQRADLLNAFKISSAGVLCSVMGGIFAEGIDLPGKLAEAAVIVGVGLPQVCTEREMMRAYYDRQGEDGFQFAYLYPGMQRVIQSAGRVIRSETDRGVILLLDRRFAEDSYQRLLPGHWYRNSPGELVCRQGEESMEEAIRNTMRGLKNVI